MADIFPVFIICAQQLRTLLLASWPHPRQEHLVQTQPTIHRLTEVQEVQATSTKEAFAAIRRDGSVVTWGSSRGGDSRGVQDQLQNVKAIQSTAGGVSNQGIQSVIQPPEVFQQKVHIAEAQSK